jgi:short subunit fatty acids transporter
MKNMASMKSEYFVHVIIIVLLVIIIAMLLMQGQNKESFDMEHFAEEKKKTFAKCTKHTECVSNNCKPSEDDIKKKYCT